MGTETQYSGYIWLMDSTVEKMGPLRGDGNSSPLLYSSFSYSVEKMGPLRGDGNLFENAHKNHTKDGREDGSPSWGRKPI